MIKTVKVFFHRMLIKLINFIQSLHISIINYYSSKQVYYHTMRKQLKKKKTTAAAASWKKSFLNCERNYNIKMLDYTCDLDK